MTTTTNQEPGILRVRNARIQYPNLLVPRGVKQDDGTTGDPRYSVVLLIPKDDPQIPAITAVLQAVAKEKWGSAAGDRWREMKAGNKLGLQDGEVKASKEGYAGNMFINASAKPENKPSLFGPIPTKQYADEELRAMFYAGAYVNAKLRVWAQDNKWGKRLNVELLGVQFAGHGEAFKSTSASASAADFDEVAVDHSAADPFGDDLS